MEMNRVGRELPEQIGDYRVRPYQGPHALWPDSRPVVSNRRLSHIDPGASKMKSTLEEAILAAGLKDGMTISFHHCFREGDQVIGQVLTAIRALGIKGL
ncbi:MAG: citrate lyase subunit alpha, partial [Oscillospiraceae bacterium]